MSHFTVLVPTYDRDALHDLMLPYKEYGYGSDDSGLEDYLVFEVEVPLDEYRSRARQLAEIMESEGHEDYRELYILEQYTEIFERYYGGTQGDEGWGYYRNPNDKWDWYVVGGRWSGLLKLKNPASLAGIDHGRGMPGVGGRMNYDADRGDYALAIDVDWEWMRQEQLNNALEKYDKYTYFKSRVTERDIELIILTAEEEHGGDDPYHEAIRQRYTPEEWAVELAANGLYRAQRETDGPFGLWWDLEELDSYQVSREEFIEKFEWDALTYAFIDLEGKWNQRGEMGWFACDNKELGTPDYDKEFWKFVKTIPEDMTVYVVDAHI